MKAQPIGTIFATQKQVTIADKHFDRLNNLELELAESELLGMTKRIVGGEIRYYKTDTIYTPAIRRNGKRRWFETRNGKDFAIQSK